MLRLERAPDAATFLSTAGAFLRAREAEHNLPLGIAARLVRTPDDDAYLSSVSDERGAVVAAAVRTPPYGPVLTEADRSEAAAMFAADLLDRYGDLPGVLGPRGPAGAFAEAWSERTGAEAEKTLAERIHRTRVAIAPDPPARGSAFPATAAHRDLLIAWLDAFVDEALPGSQPRERSDELVDQRLTDPDAGYALWEDEGRPVALVGWGGRTPNGIRIGPVYTPPEHRRRGYAGALTAAVTARLLTTHRFCFLFTDLANPTSNALYARIGYEPVTDVDQYRFGPPD